MCISANTTKRSRRSYFEDELGVMHGDASKNVSAVQAVFNASIKNAAATPDTAKTESRTQEQPRSWQQLDLF